MMFAVIAAAIIVTMALALARALLGPTTFDRILAVNMFATKTTLLIAVVGFLAGRPDFVDIALVYALINFIGTIALLRVYRFGGLGDAGVPPESEG
jgi:multicomponent Na+:H+ antiporter subunit F